MEHAFLVLVVFLPEVALAAAGYICLRSFNRAMTAPSESAAHLAAVGLMEMERRGLLSGVSPRSVSAIRASCASALIPRQTFNLSDRIPFSVQAPQLRP